MLNNPLNTITNFFKKGILRLFRRTAQNTSKNYHYDMDGIDHDHGVITNYIRKSDISFKTNIENLNRDLLRGNEVITAVYLASGSDTKENLLNRYSQMKGINNLILIDYRIDEYNCIMVNDTYRIFSIPCEVVKSSIVLEKCQVTINLLIDINCGINLGNGYFSTSAVLVQSLFEPMCSTNQFIFIGSRAYQKCNAQYNVAKDYLSCFCYENKKSINPDKLIELGLEIDLPNLTTYTWSSKEIDITLFNTKKLDTELTIQKGDIKLHFVQGNIFNMKNELDIMFLYYRNLFMYRQFNRTIINALDFRGKYKNKLSGSLFAVPPVVSEEYDFMQSEDLIQFSNTYMVKKVGFIPLKDFDYVLYINTVCTMKSEITDLYFFYYDAKDLDNIYKVMEIATI